jgi:hypothetical protein
VNSISAIASGESWTLLCRETMVLKTPRLFIRYCRHPEISESRLRTRISLPKSSRASSCLPL